MDELEEIRKRRLQELQERQRHMQDQDPQEESDRAADDEAAIERFLQQILDDEARTRLTRIRMSRPDLADQVARQLVALAQSGRLRNRLSDEELRKILVQLQPDERDTSITRK